MQENFSGENAESYIYPVPCFHVPISKVEIHFVKAVVVPQIKTKALSIFICSADRPPSATPLDRI